MQTPTLHHYHPDHLGTTSYISDKDQNLVQHERYFAFGELWRPGGEQEESQPDATRREWLFTGKEWDVDTGLYYFGARYFDPHTDVWQSTDPILASYMKGGVTGASPKNLGLYTYGWNNPIVMRDPNGRHVVGLPLSVYDRPGHFGETAQMAQEHGGMIAIGGLVGAAVALAPELIPILARAAPSVLARIGILGAAAARAQSDPRVQQAERTLVNQGQTIAAEAQTLAPAGQQVATQLVQLTNGQIGRIIGWGEGQTLTQVRQTIAVTGDLTRETVQSWAAQGVTREWLVQQLNLYRAQMSDLAAPANFQLIPRADLMEKALSLWPK
jgi:RHS repeat-associated protein